MKQKLTKGNRKTLEECKITQEMKGKWARGKQVTNLKMNK